VSIVTDRSKSVRITLNGSSVQRMFNGAGCQTREIMLAEEVEIDGVLFPLTPGDVLEAQIEIREPGRPGGMFAGAGCVTGRAMREMLEVIGRGARR